MFHFSNAWDVYHASHVMHERQMAIMHHMHFIHYMHVLYPHMHHMLYYCNIAYYCNRRDKLYYCTRNILYSSSNINTSYFRFSSFFDKKPSAYFPDSRFSFCLLSYAEINAITVGYIPKLQAMKDFCEHCRYEKQTRSSHSLSYEIVR